ncbi:TatD family hydrolase [Varibaculum vaginae]|uniref:TatD family hydrolase n=1 Tax=Varibaculum vaginae TaxID=2364797 RepID=UPI000F0867F9|nr:TatD family hydrolase [Varibaculum vaginae]
MGKSRKRRGWPQLPVPLAGKIVDNHTHLPLWEEQIPLVEGVRLSLAEQLERAGQVGVSAMITSGCQLDELAPTVEVSEEYPQVFCALAIHPNEAALHEKVVATAPDGQTYQLQEWHRQYSLEAAVAQVYAAATSAPKCVAIGETGLDYFRTSPQGRQAQQQGFRMHISLAKELGLPLQIHDREAHADTIRILLEEGAPERTVFHCFSGDKEMAQVLAEQGWYASIAGPVTYNANQWQREAVAAMPASLLLVETDAPYLTPHPHRGQPNASYMSVWTVRKLAEITGRSESEMAGQLLKNTREVYGEKISGFAD